MATKGRNLRSGYPVWQGRRAPVVATTQLSRDITTDVLIIGAGITGAVIGDALAAAGLQVAIVDKHGRVAVHTGARCIAGRAA